MYVDGTRSDTNGYDRGKVDSDMYLSIYVWYLAHLICSGSCDVSEGTCYYLPTLELGI